MPGRPGRQPDGRELVPAHAAHAAHHQQRAAQFRHAGVLRPCPVRHAGASRAGGAGGAGRVTGGPCREASAASRASMRPAAGPPQRGWRPPPWRAAPARSPPPRWPWGPPRRGQLLAGVGDRKHRAGQGGAAGGVAIAVHGAQRALLQHALPDQPPCQQGDPLRGRQRAGAHQLSERPEPVRLRERGGQPAAPRGPLRVPLAGMPRAHSRGVTGERARPGQCRIVPGVGKITVQRPQAAHETLRLGGHRLRHVPARGGDRPDDGHRALPPAGGDHLARPLVEGGQRGRQAGRVSLLGRQLPGAGGELAQRLRPPRGGVRDDHGIQAHVAEMLGDGRGTVDAGLAGHHRHVGGVGDYHGPVGEPPTGARVGELGEFGEQFGELVAPLAAARRRRSRRRRTIWRSAGAARSCRCRTRPARPPSRPGSPGTACRPPAAR